MAFFLSTYANKVDKKGRVSVPAPFRTAVATDPASSHFSGIVIYQPKGLQCIEGADISFLEQLSNRLYSDDKPFTPEQAARATHVFSTSSQLAFDPEGRVSIPAGMCQYAGIDGQVLFVGLGRKFQIWNPDIYADYKSWLDDMASGEGAELPGFGVQGLSPHGGGS